MRLRRRVVVRARLGAYGLVLTRQRGIGLTGRRRDPVGLRRRKRERRARALRLGRRGRQRPPGPPPGRRHRSNDRSTERRRSGRKLRQPALAAAACATPRSMRVHGHTLRRHRLAERRAPVRRGRALGGRHDRALGGSAGSRGDHDGFVGRARPPASPSGPAALALTRVLGRDQLLPWLLGLAPATPGRRGGHRVLHGHRALQEGIRGGPPCAPPPAAAGSTGGAARLLLRQGESTAGGRCRRSHGP